MEKKIISKGKFYIGLHLSLLLFSFAGVFSKFAAQYSLMSWGFVLFYLANLTVCGVFAIMWQQFLKYIPLNTAYSNRIVTMIWSMIWGVLIFQEKITLQMIIGTIVILLGLRLVVTADE